MDAGFEVLVSDIGDEGQVVVEALDGLETWARLLARRRGAERIEPTDGG